MKKFAAAVLVSAMAMLGSVPAASAAETASTNEYLCVVYGESGFTLPLFDYVVNTEAYIVVDRTYADALIKEGEGVCPVFSSEWLFNGTGRSFDYEYVGGCSQAAIDVSVYGVDTNAELCSHIAESVGVIDSTDIGGGCINSSSVVDKCGRYDVRTY